MFTRKDTYTIPDGYREALFKNWPCLGYQNQIKADPSCLLSPHCHIVGHVELGYHSIVLSGARLRADSDKIIIGAETNIQENCILHESEGFPLVIGEHTTIGHGAILHGCTIGDNVLIGMGAIIMDGVVIGHNSVVGAGAVVTEGTVIPECSLVVGVPGKVRKQITQEDIDNISTRYTEANLAEAANMFKEGMLHCPNEDLLRKIGAVSS
jgi:carbonic anhydrase/acetyltransferase-like protein (isoleucine patch superfamily)